MKTENSVDVLSQDEVDNLFADDPSPVAVAAEAAPASRHEAPREREVRGFDIANQERIVRGRMPTLEIINERFARNVRLALFNFIQRSPELAIGPVRAVKYSAFVSELVLPTNINILQMKTLRGMAIFVLEPTLVFGLIETLFGGNGRIHARIEGRDFTATEMRIVQRTLDILVAEYMKAWSPVYDLQLEYVRSEMQPQFVNIATPSEVVIATRIDFDLGHVQGGVHICLPYASLEPIRDLLLATAQAEPGEGDSRWSGRLKRHVQSAEVELEVPLAHVQASLRQVLALRVGDVLNLDVPPLVTASVDAVPLFRARPGVVQGKLAVRVEELVKQSPALRKPGERPVR